MDNFNKTLVDNWVRVGKIGGREKKGKEDVGAFTAYLTTSYNILI